MEASSESLMETEEGFQPVFFSPRPLTNLLLIDELDSLSPVMDMKVSASAPHRHRHTQLQPTL